MASQNIRRVEVIKFDDIDQSSFIASRAVKRTSFSTGTRKTQRSTYTAVSKMFNFRPGDNPARYPKKQMPVYFDSAGTIVLKARDGVSFGKQGICIGWRADRLPKNAVQMQHTYMHMGWRDQMQEKRIH